MKVTSRTITVTKLEKGVVIELSQEEARIVRDIMARNVIVPNALGLLDEARDRMTCLMGDIHHEIVESLEVIKKN